MIDTTPKLLRRRRLQKLVNGLRERMSTSSQRIAQEVELLRSKIQGLEVDYRQNVDRSKDAGQRSINAMITQWDEARHERWNECEGRAFHAIHGFSARENSIRATAREQGEQVTAVAKQKVAEAENWFMKSKNVPIAQLREMKSALDMKLQEVFVVRHDAETLLAQRSLNVPPVELSTAAVAVPATARECCQRSAQAIVEATGHLSSLANNRVTRAVGSIWFWLTCIVIAGSMAAVLGLTQLVVWPVAVVVSVICLIVQVVAAQLAVLPLLRSIAAVEYPKVMQALDDAQKLVEAGQKLAMQESEAELKKLADKRDGRIDRVTKKLEQEIADLNQRAKQQLEQLYASLVSEKRSASEQLTQLIGATDQQFRSRQQELIANHEKTLAENESQFNDQRGAIQTEIERIDRGGIHRIVHATKKAIRILGCSNGWIESRFPDWSVPDWQNGKWPARMEMPILPVGNLAIDELIHEAARVNGTVSHSAPVTFEPIDDKYLTITGDPSSETCQRLVRNLILRALTSLPPGKTQVCVIDPPGLGRDYGWLMHLADFDPQLVMHRVWTQPGHIAKQVEQLAMNAEDFIQQSLRNQYRSIVEYNRDAGSLAEPYRLLVWSSFPSGLDESSWKSLQSLLDTGSRCGIIPILIIDPALPCSAADQREFVRRRGLHLEVADGGTSLRLSQPGLSDLSIDPPTLPDESRQQWLVEESGRQAILASRVEVPLESIMPQASERWLADSSKSLEIPIGQSGVGRVHSMKLGIGTAQHAIIAGKTGSGKSTLLHAMITSAAMKYSPSRLRMVLLDFKKGVEFQVYGQGRLPHADILGIESQREFGLSALEHIDRCMQIRGQMFREAGVQDLANWNLVRPDNQMPRVLIVIDEFQELFVEDDKLSNQCSLILDRIVRQGRSFGIHSILSSQTLAGAYSLPRTTMGQMAVRIALQCDAADAQMIFADDNPAASRLKHPGQAVYNDAGGRIEGNQSMQIGWLTKHKQIDWFASMPQGYQNSDPSTNMLGRAVVFEGNRASQWDEVTANLAIETAQQTLNPMACWCVLGESVAINPAVVIPVTQQAGRNILVVGAEDMQAAAVMNAIMASFERHHRHKGCSLLFINAAKPTDAGCLQLAERLKTTPGNVQVIEARGVDQSLAQLHAELKLRLDNAQDESTWLPTLLILAQVGRMRTLRREDEFGLGSFGESSITSDKMLEEILRDGPSHSIHVMIWAENAATAGRWLSRTAMREIELRILMQMGANDSTNLIDSVSASRLSSHVMLVHDDATSTEQRFRPYDFESLADIDRWVKPA